jgi:hypothetical protein
MRIYSTRTCRAKVIHFPINLFFQIFNGDLWTRLRLLPEDAQVADVFYEFDRHAFGVVVTSESFDPVPEGTVFPVLELAVEVQTFTAQNQIEIELVRMKDGKLQTDDTN